MLILVLSAAKTISGDSTAISASGVQATNGDAMQKLAKSWAASFRLKMVVAPLPPVPAAEGKGVVYLGKESVHIRTLL